MIIVNWDSFIKTFGHPRLNNNICPDLFCFWKTMWGKLNASNNFMYHIHSTVCNQKPVKVLPSSEKTEHMLLYGHNKTFQKKVDLLLLQNQEEKCVYSLLLFATFNTHAHLMPHHIYTIYGFLITLDTSRKAIVLCKYQHRLNKVVKVPTEHIVPLGATAASCRQEDQTSGVSLHLGPQPFLCPALIGRTNSDGREANRKTTACW